MRRSLTGLLSVPFLSMALVSATCVAQTPPAYRAGSLTKQEAQSIYALDPQDPWNRIFYLLFTRTVKLRLADSFKARTTPPPPRISALG